MVFGQVVTRLDDYQAFACAGWSKDHEQSMSQCILEDSQDTQLLLSIQGLFEFQAIPQLGQVLIADLQM
jgi:hypothetical protein